MMLIFFLILGAIYQTTALKLEFSSLTLKKEHSKNERILSKEKLKRRIFTADKDEQEIAISFFFFMFNIERKKKKTILFYFVHQ